MNKKSSSPPLPFRVALIGAGGFFGTNLARHLAPRVGELRCFGLHPSFPEALAGLTWVTGDMADAQANVIDSLHLFDHCVAAGGKHFVFISSGVAIYGIPGHVPIRGAANQ